MYLDITYLVYCCYSLGTKSRNNQSRTGSQVQCIDTGTCETLYSVNNGNIALDLYI